MNNAINKNRKLSALGTQGDRDIYDRERHHEHAPLGMRNAGYANPGSLALSSPAGDQMHCLIPHVYKDPYGRHVNPNTIDTEKTHCPLTIPMYRESQLELGRPSTLARYATAMVNRANHPNHRLVEIDDRLVEVRRRGPARGYTPGEMPALGYTPGEMPTLGYKPQVETYDMPTKHGPPVLTQFECDFLEKNHYGFGFTKNNWYTAECFNHMADKSKPPFTTGRLVETPRKTTSQLLEQAIMDDAVALEREKLRKSRNRKTDIKVGRKDEFFTNRCGIKENMAMGSSNSGDTPSDLPDWDLGLEP